MKKFFKYFLYAIGGLFLLMIGIYMLIPKSELERQAKEREERDSIENLSSEKQSMNEADTNTRAVSPTADEIAFDSVRRVTSIIEHIDKLSKIATLKERFENDDKTKELINSLQLLQTRYFIEKKYLETTLPANESKKLIKRYTKEIKEVLRWEYGQARENYRMSIDAPFKDENVNIVLIGGNKAGVGNGSEIVLISPAFTLEKNIVAYKKVFDEFNIFEDYRFNKITFRWYNRDEGKSWHYTTPSDLDIIDYR